MPTRRRGVRTVAILLLAVLGAVGCNKIKARQEVKRGNEFFKAGQYQAALAAYQEAKRVDPAETKLDKRMTSAATAVFISFPFREGDLVTYPWTSEAWLLLLLATRPSVPPILPEDGVRDTYR